MMQLSDAQSAYVATTTNARGGAFRTPYEFSSSIRVGHQNDLLSIEAVTEGGAIVGAAFKGPKGWYDLAANDPAFQKLVADTLTALEKNMRGQK